MRCEHFNVAGRPATAFVGGTDTPLVLIHGGWGGAAAHWSRIWDRLAERFLVIAPELPGVGDRTQPGLGGISDYAAWIEALLDARGIEAAVLVGNSFGAAIACAVATRSPARVRSLVMVNGVPFPRMASIFTHAAAWGPTRAVMKRIFRFNSFSPRAMAQAFARPDEIPDDLRAAFVGEPPQMDALLDALARGGDDRLPLVRTLLLFGDADRFPPSNPRAARKLQARIPGAQLALVPGAGHLPQLENPDAFLTALMPFIRSGWGRYGAGSGPRFAKGCQWNFWRRWPAGPRSRRLGQIDPVKLIRARNIHRAPNRIGTTKGP
jgi:pimeloyl-ACP methyl ester carboxylesterase